MRHSHCWRCCIHDQISWGCDVMPMFRRTLCSRCKALAVVNYVTAVQVHLTSKAFIIKLAQLHDFSAFVLSKKIILQTVCNREHSQKGGKAQLQCLQTAYNFSVPYMIFSKKQTSPASPGDALTALLPHSVALRKAQCCSALTVMIQSSAAPSSALLLLQVYHYRLTRDCIHMAVGMLLHTSYNKVPTFSLNSFLCLPCPKKYFVRHRCLS